MELFCSASVVSRCVHYAHGKRQSPVAKEPASRLMAKITLLDGAAYIMKFDGVGCSASICSRTVLKGRGDRDAMVSTRLDSIATIKDSTGDNALFLMKDGSQRRISLVTDFRVLYLINDKGAQEKVDLAKVKSVEFLGAAR
jgi:hypothetical protein